MPSVENSLKYEGEAGPGVVRLVQSGEFVRAYERSAWRFYCCISKYKVIRMYSKRLQREVFFLGFPASKLLELADGRVCTKTDFGWDVALKEGEAPAEEGYEAWTREVPVEAASRAAEAALPPSAREVEAAVCRKIRGWPLETKSPVEALVFLSEMRKLLIGEREG